MNDENEIDRVRDVRFDYCYEASCRVCGREFKLWPPGDNNHESCCGFDYWIEYPALDFVTYRVAK